MAVKGAYARKTTIRATFVTDKDTFYLDSVYNLGGDNGTTLYASGEMTNGIVSFNTTNDMSEDSATFSIVAIGTERWDIVLSPNDIVILQVNPGLPRKVDNDVIMVGMVSEVKRVGSYDSSSVIYQITGQSMMKVLMQLKLGTIQELTSLLGTNGWMMGMGGMSGASEYIEAGGGDGDDDDEEKGAEDLYTPKPTNSNTIYPSDQYLGGAIKSVSSNTKAAVVSKKSYPGSKGKGYLYIPKYGLAKIVGYIEDSGDLKLLAKQSKVMVNVPKKEAGKGFGSAVKVSYYKKRPSKKTKKSGDDSTGADDSQGLSIFGASAAEVVQQLYDWFVVDHLRYNYGNNFGKVSEYIDTDFTSRPEEKLADVQPIMSYEGSFRQLVTESQAKPFNEFYGEFEPDDKMGGKMKLIMRPTPFEPEDWHILEDSARIVHSNDVLEETVGQTDKEVYSIFSATMPSTVMVSKMSQLLSFPVYFPELAFRYGYSMLQVSNPYIFDLMADSDDDDDSSDSEADSGNLPSISSGDVNDIGKASMAWGKNKDNKAYSAKNINKFIKTAHPSSRFAGHGDVFMKAGKQSGLDPIIILAFAALESAWGNSAIAKAHNNFFGIGAFDNNPGNSSNYSNDGIAAGIIGGAKWIRKNYFDAGQKTLYSLFNNGGNHQYSTTPDEWKRIGSIAAPYFKMFPLKSKKSKLSDIADKFNNAVNSQVVDPVTSAKDVKKAKNKKKKQKERAEGSSGNDNATRLKQYSVMLANWYGDNFTFQSGEIRVVGNPDYRVGSIIYRYDGGTTEDGQLADVDKHKVWEYYVESVSHEFSFTGGYTTTLGVTRGLDMEVDRFGHWNTWDDPLTRDKPGVGGLQQFGGGLFGELSLYENGKQNEEGDSDDDTNDDSDDTTDTGGADGKDDYPEPYKSAGQDTLNDPWTYINRECTSFAAFRVAKHGRKGYRNLHNAATWGTIASQYVKKTPKKGDVAWWAANSVPYVGAYGHVGYVGGVSKGGTIFVEEYNYGTPAGKYHTRSISKNSSQYPSGFIRFPKG